MVEISKNIIIKELNKRIEDIFSLPETCSVKIRDIVIEKIQSQETIQESILKAVENCYHDVLSDTDLAVTVKLSPYDTVTPDQYMQMIERYKITSDNYLGLAFVKESKMYRIILQNGMRYDFGFAFLLDEKADKFIIELDTNQNKNDDNTHLPLENIDRFWFVQIQALAKLYRNDFLIGDHLANMNINETLVLQMVLRDIKYGTNFHRYGYQEELEYLQSVETECPYEKENPIFNLIARKLFSASLIYDKLAPKLNCQYKDRRKIFLDIWDRYDKELSQFKSEK